MQGCSRREEFQLREPRERDVASAQLNLLRRFDGRASPRRLVTRRKGDERPRASRMIEMTSNEEIDRAIAELRDHHERFDRMSTDTDLPVLVRQTPNWEDGWRVLEAWVCRHPDLPPGGWAGGSFRPRYDTTWAREVHIFSHYLHALRGDSGHTLRHAAIEEEGTRLVLEWWNERLGK
jgi:hypothetical protein